MQTPELTILTLEETLIEALSSTPLDDFIDALENAFRRRVPDVPDPADADLYRNAADELRALKNRDFALSDDAEEAFN
jgi:hypothetical protein